jgi:hypothetical protein
MKTFLGFTTRLLGGTIGGIILVYFVMSIDGGVREYILNATKPNDSDLFGMGNYDIHVEDLND